MRPGIWEKGTATVGTQRQHTGTAGRVENAQVAVYLTYAGEVGHAMIDRELYLPKSWTSDPARFAAAGVPEGLALATKPELAQTMLARALEAGVPARWVAAGEVYGADPGLRADLEAREMGYVLAISCDRRVPTAAGAMRPDALAANLPKSAWQRLLAGPGAKGQRYYDWAWITLTAQAGHHWLLIRRHPRHGELAFYRCYSPTPVPLGELVRIAGRRWTIEESFQTAKGPAGLDEHQLRRWLAWRRWTLLAMRAHALLAVIAATERTQHPPQPGLITLTCNEIRHLFTKLITEPTRRLTNPLAWSHWRRRHQHQARASHYRRQQAQLT